MKKNKREQKRNKHWPCGFASEPHHCICKWSYCAISPYFEPSNPLPTKSYSTAGYTSTILPRRPRTLKLWIALKPNWTIDDGHGFIRKTCVPYKRKENKEKRVEKHEISVINQRQSILKTIV